MGKGLKTTSSAEPSGRNRVSRIAVLNSHPIQYFAPLYRYLNTDPDFEITALYLSDLSIRGGADPGFGRTVKWDVDLLDGYRAVFLGNASKRDPGGFWSLVAPEVCTEIRSGHYDALWLHGHNYAANLLALLTAKISGLPVLMRSETHLGLRRSAIKAAVRRPTLGSLYSLCDRFLAIGSNNAAFYRAMGVLEREIFFVPYSVDNDRFIQASTLSVAERGRARSEYDIPVNQPVVLYAAKFTARKRPQDLLYAVEKLRSRGCDGFTVVMAGSGELEGVLKEFCHRKSLSNVIFTGFINQSDLPTLYGISDIFVLPSENEPWGLAVNEAMCAGLPIVVTREVGCVADLVEDGVNGYAMETGDIEGLSVALETLIRDQNLRHRLGAASRERIQQWGFKQCLTGLKQAVLSLPVSV